MLLDAESQIQVLNSPFCMENNLHVYIFYRDTIDPLNNSEPKVGFLDMRVVHEFF